MVFIFFVFIFFVMIDCFGTQQINCEHPVIIINPQLPTLLSKYGYYHVCGRTYPCPKRKTILFDFPRSLFHPKRNNVTLDTLDDFYVEDDETKERFPMYLAVPCNKCDVCKGAKINAFVHRCKLESQSYDSLPWFCTLTYDDEHCPEHGVDVREMQLFMKRFRINLQRAGFSFKPRYVIVGEYGKNTHRPHYHALFWNINSRSDLDYLKVADIIRSSWSKGYIMHRLVDLSDDKGFYYTAKYLRKDCVVPEGCNPCFLLSSRGNGGIGSRFIDKIAPELRKTLNTEFKFLNKWSGKVENLCMCSYLLNRVFPTFSRSVPKFYRDCWIDYNLSMNILLNRSENFKHYYESEFTFYSEIRQKVKDFFYCPEFRTFPNFNFYGWSCQDALSVLRSVKQNLLESGLLEHLSFYKELEEKRKKFLEKIFKGMPLINLSDKSFNLRRQFALSAAREIL